MTLRSLHLADLSAGDERAGAAGDDLALRHRRSGGDRTTDGRVNTLG
jgi:hypothetical protein